MGTFDDACRAERDTALLRLQMHYTRAPEKRRELAKPVNDEEKTTLQRRLPNMVMSEFSRTWNKHVGAQP